MRCAYMSLSSLCVCLLVCLFVSLLASPLLPSHAADAGSVGPAFRATHGALYVQHFFAIKHTKMNSGLIQRRRNAINSKGGVFHHLCSTFRWRTSHEVAIHRQPTQLAAV